MNQTENQIKQLADEIPLPETGRKSVVLSDIDDHCTAETIQPSAVGLHRLN